MRFLNEDPWERLRTLRKHLPNTKLQMLFRGQNILGYKHYADDGLTFLAPPRKVTKESGLRAIALKNPNFCFYFATPMTW